MSVSQLPLDAGPTPPEPAACLQYRSADTALEGVVERATFAGPPNYESVAKGDHKETYWLLRVIHPFCVDASYDLSGNVNEAAHAGVRKIQLVFLDGDQSYAAHRALVGRKVRATGELFGAHTGHHRTDVLMAVTRLEPAGVHSVK